MNILICTPGRLLQHMDETPEFDASHVQILVLDEADRILDLVMPPHKPAEMQSSLFFDRQQVELYIENQLQGMEGSLRGQLLYCARKQASIAVAMQMQVHMFRSHDVRKII